MDDMDIIAVRDNPGNVVDDLVEMDELDDVRDDLAVIDNSIMMMLTAITTTMMMVMVIVMMTTTMMTMTTIVIIYNIIISVPILLNRSEVGQAFRSAAWLSR